MRRTAASGTKNTRLRVAFFPVLVRSSMVPTPIAYMQDPPRPLMGCGGISLRVLKSERFGDTWQEAPESRTKGDVCGFLWSEEGEEFDGEFGSA